MQNLELTIERVLVNDARVPREAAERVRGLLTEELARALAEEPELHVEESAALTKIEIEGVVHEARFGERDLARQLAAQITQMVREMR